MSSFKIKVGDEVEYIGDRSDNEELYEEFEENGFVHEVTGIIGDKVQVLGCQHSIDSKFLGYYPFN